MVLPNLRCLVLSPKKALHHHNQEPEKVKNTYSQMLDSKVEVSTTQVLLTAARLE